MRSIKVNAVPPFLGYCFTRCFAVCVSLNFMKLTMNLLYRHHYYFPRVMYIPPEHFAVSGNIPNNLLCCISRGWVVQMPAEFITAHHNPSPFQLNVLHCMGSRRQHKLFYNQYLKEKQIIVICTYNLMKKHLLNT